MLRNKWGSGLMWKSCSRSVGTWGKRGVLATWTRTQVTSPRPTYLLSTVWQAQKQSFWLQVSKSMRAYVWKPECWLINWCWAINYWQIQMFTVCWWEHYSLLAKPNVTIKMLPGSMNSEQDTVTGVLSLWYLVRPSSPGIYPQVLMFTGYGSVSFEQRWSHADRFYLSGFFS